MKHVLSRDPALYDLEKDQTFFDATSFFGPDTSVCEQSLLIQPAIPYFDS